MNDPGEVVDEAAYRLLLISRICQEFNCLPSEAARELMEDPEQLVFSVMEARSYMACKEAYDSTTSETDDKLEPWLDSPMLELVKATTLRLTRRVATGFAKKIVLTDK